MAFCEFVHLPLLSSVIAGCSDIAIYRPICVTAAYFNDGPAHSADGSPVYGWYRNGEKWVRIPWEPPSTKHACNKCLFCEPSLYLKLYLYKIF